MTLICVLYVILWGLECEEFNPAQVVENIERLYTGFSSILVDEQTIDQLYSGEEHYFRA